MEKPRVKVAYRTASPTYVADQHRLLRSLLRKRFAEQVADATRIVYDGPVTPSDGRDLMSTDCSSAAQLGNRTAMLKSLISLPKRQICGEIEL
ncbi:MAG: hypothetical protein ABW080_15870 [Candidatus Thiodiazotropha sp.]